MANPNIKGTHFQGPVLNSDASRGGLFRDVPVAATESVRSPFNVKVEEFGTSLADDNLEACGVTLTDINTATSPTEVIDGASGHLLINPGTKADSGTQVAFNAAPSGATTASPDLKVLGPIVSTATLMDSRELFFETRVGFGSDTAVWDGKVCIGWLANDTLAMTSATGVLALAEGGGGMGFHVGEDGALGYFTSAGSITTSTATGVNILTDLAAAANGGAFLYYTLGVRAFFNDASASTGATEFYLNGRKIATVADSVPMDSTETYGMVYEVQNGPARATDLAVDYIITGISRAGLTVPYSSGNW